MMRNRGHWICVVGGALLIAGCRGPGGIPASQPAAKPPPRRDTIPPRVYPVDYYGFSPVDKALQKAFAREEMIKDDDEGSLNPYVMRVVAAYPLDGSYPYHCSWNPREYDIYNGVTQDMWYKGMVVAKAYPDGSRCSYCCGLTFEIFMRAMKLRNVQKGLDPDDFNGMSFADMFNLLQLWYIEGKGDCERRGIVGYGLGRAITDLEQARPGDFLSYDTAPSGGHSVIFIDWLRDGTASLDKDATPPLDKDNSPPLAKGGPGGVAGGKIIGMKYFSSNSSGTKGAGYGQGKFSDCNNGRGLLRNSVRLARVGSIADYKSFDRLKIPCRNAYAPVQP